MTTRQHIFEAGQYWIGDPCYAIKDENWSKVIEETGCFGLEHDGLNWDDGLFDYSGKQCFASGTAYGDGSYLDQKGNMFPVDAGLLGILPVNVCDGDYLAGGHVFEFAHSFEVFEQYGKFYFGNVIINTDDTNDEEEYVEDEYEDDDIDSEYSLDSEE